MQRPVIATFEHLPDRMAAEAFSELKVREDEFKVASDPFADYPANELFPPEPAYYSAVIAAYWEDEVTERGPRRQLVFAPSDHRSLEDLGEAFVDGYRTVVGHYHQLAGITDLRGDMPPALDALRRRSALLALETDLRTVAAFAVYSAVEGERHYSGLVIPKKTYNELPLESRETWIGILGLFNRVVDEHMPHLQPRLDSIRDMVRPVLRGEPVAKKIAFFAAALNLPEVEQVEQNVAQHLEIQNRREKDPYAGLSREERRRLQIQERRQARKRPRQD